MSLIKDKNIYYYNEFLDNYNGLKLFIEKEKYNGISYNYKLNIELHKEDIIYNYYEYKLIRDCDIIDNIKFNCDDVIIKIIIGDLEFDLQDIDDFYFVASMYSPLKFRFIFDKIPDNKNITLTYRKYLINNEW